MSKINKVKLLSERTSGVPPVIFGHHAGHLHAEEGEDRVQMLHIWICMVSIGRFLQGISMLAISDVATGHNYTLNF